MLLSAFANLMRKGVKKMALRFALLVVCLVVLIFCLDYVLPKLIDKYRKYRELKTEKRDKRHLKRKWKN